MQTENNSIDKQVKKRKKGNQVQVNTIEKSRKAKYANLFKNRLRIFSVLF